MAGSAPVLIRSSTSATERHLQNAPPKATLQVGPRSKDATSGGGHPKQVGGHRYERSKDATSLLGSSFHSRMHASLLFLESQ